MSKFAYCLLLAAFFIFLAKSSSGQDKSISTNTPFEVVNGIDPARDNFFKYGSIGADHKAALPFKIWKVLPRLCPDRLPNRGKDGYENFGFIFEPGKEIPIGFSVTKHNFSPFAAIGITCAGCHTATFRDSDQDTPRLVYGMGASRLDIMNYITFTLECLADERQVTFAKIRRALREIGDPLNLRERAALRLGMGILQTEAAGTAERFNRILDIEPPAGLGRNDSVNPYKVLYLDQQNFPGDEAIANSKLMSVFNGHLIDDMWTHWDGSILETETRNALIGLGSTTRENLPRAEPFLKEKHQARADVQQYLRELRSPDYPRPVDSDLIANRNNRSNNRELSGEQAYNYHCSSCHGTLAERRGALVAADSRLGEIVSMAEIGTDHQRVESLTDEFARDLKPWIERLIENPTVRNTDGLRNSFLDGVFLRAPYLHNGSVPTLADLLKHPDDRPTHFYKGSDILDHERMGFISRLAQFDETQVPSLERERFDTTIKGNGNRGHVYGVTLSANEKRALIEYMKLF